MNDRRRVEVAQYNSQLKSVTGGRGSYSMTLSHYEPVPPQIQQQVIAMYKKDTGKEEEHQTEYERSLKWGHGFFLHHSGASSSFNSECFWIR